MARMFKNEEVGWSDEEFEGTDPEEPREEDVPSPEGGGPPAEALDLDPDSTDALLDRYRKGDSGSLERLFIRHLEAVQRIVRIRTGSFLRSRAEEEDVLSEVLLEALRSIDTYRSRCDARFIQWLSKVAENRIRGLVEREGALKRLPTGRMISLQATRFDREASTVAHQIAAEFTSASEALGRKEMCAILDDCLRAEAKPIHREVILMRDYAGGDWDWIAQELGCPTKEAAKELHQRAIKKLKERVRVRLGSGPDASC